jgi:TetR/AcrR family transcriptional repressor of nem operon
MTEGQTATLLLDAAQRLVAERGFNAFSYKDLAAAVGIRTASIHYHFETKADLGKALVERYHESLIATLAELDRKGRTNVARLRSLVQVYRGTERSGVICLCGSLASDLETLREDVQRTVRSYLTVTCDWVERKISDGVRAGEFEPVASPADLAASLVAGLQGGLLVGRATDRSFLDAVQRTFLKALGA